MTEKTRSKRQFTQDFEECIIVALDLPELKCPRGWMSGLEAMGVSLFPSGGG